MPSLAVQAVDSIPIREAGWTLAQLSDVVVNLVFRAVNRLLHTNKFA